MSYEEWDSFDGSSLMIDSPQRENMPRQQNSPIGGIAGGAATTVGGLATGNPLLIAAGVIQTLGSIFAAFTKKREYTPQEQFYMEITDYYKRIGQNRNFGKALTHAVTGQQPVDNWSASTELEKDWPAWKERYGVVGRRGEGAPSKPLVADDAAAGKREMRKADRGLN